MKILFWFRKSESQSQLSSFDPLGTIQCRITIENAPIEIGSTGVSCKKSIWNPSQQRLDGSTTRILNHNKRLQEVTRNLERLYDVLSTKYEFVSPSTVKDYYLSKKKFTYTITEIKTSFLAHREKMVAQGSITETTLYVNENYCKHILEFATEEGILRPIEIKDSFFHDLFEWMIDSERSNMRFARKVCSFARQLLKWAVKKKMSPHLSAFAENLPGKPDSEDDLDTTHLSIFQLDRLLHFNFEKLVERNQLTRESAQTLSQERDAFVFNCFTGMHHCDYTKKNFRIEQYRGTTFLKGKRQKTKKAFAIKLLDPALRILHRYENDLKKLPVKSNQKRNGTLKQIAVLVELPILLTTKIARKTFCDLALNEMLMTADDVAACLGLTSTRFLKNYGRIREKRLMKVMKSWDQLKKAS